MADDSTVVDIEHDRVESHHKFVRYPAHVVREGLGDSAGTCIDPKTQIFDDNAACLVRGDIPL